MNRQHNVTGPDRLWLTDISEHPTAEGKLYRAAVMDAWSRRIVGWSIAPHIRTELGVLKHLRLLQKVRSGTQ